MVAANKVKGGRTKRRKEGKGHVMHCGENASGDEINVVLHFAPVVQRMTFSPARLLQLRVKEEREEDAARQQQDLVQTVQVGAHDECESGILKL
ncbi:unnamed protein product [Thelazia callipaeda]|uniref:Uncharacterized protein n=1 Tax=Thelazia callipaeda TaxID=103827 RepID=A0A0N5D1C4_THECL|nr:unnamed protein product [Thelazia callipaeda]